MENIANSARTQKSFQPPPGISTAPGYPPQPQPWGPLNGNQPQQDPWARAAAGLGASAAATSFGPSSIENPWGQTNQSTVHSTPPSTGFPMHSSGASAGPAAMPQSAPDGGSSGWAAGFGTNVGPWHEKDWTVGEKVSRELKAFDGQILQCSNWRNRIRDHFITTIVHSSLLLLYPTALSGTSSWRSWRALQ